MGRNVKEQWRIFEVPSKSGVARELLPEGDDQGVPTWAPDGKSLIFGDRLGRKPRPEMSIHVLNLSTRKLTDLAESKGLWSPRWSPDGRYIAAITSDSKAIRIAPAQGGPWRELVKMNFVDNATWSPDSRYIYFNANDEINHRWLLRLTIPGGKLERLADLADFTDGIEGWYGVGPGDVPLAFHGVAVQEIYRLQCILP
jgi:Tol biopolymer transport system component